LLENTQHRKVVPENFLKTSSKFTFFSVLDFISLGGKSFTLLFDGNLFLCKHQTKAINLSKKISVSV